MLDKKQSAETTARRPHLVQLYDANEQALSTNVVSYLGDGLKSGCGALVVATPTHKVSFYGELIQAGVDAESEIEAGRLVFLDAETTLARIMIGGHPDADRFERIVGSAVKEVKSLTRADGIRVYGEMVGLLWKARQFPAAIRLEQLWNKLQSTTAFDLFCAYPIDVFDKDFDIGVVDAILCAHSHLLPTEANATLQRALDRAISEIHGPHPAKRDSRTRKHLRKNWGTLPEPETTILWLRANVPDEAEDILSRARTYYHAST